MAGSVSGNPVLAAIEQSAIPTVMAWVDALAKQVAVLTASAGDSYGTLTGVRRNPKPFIVGFIVPDNPVDFIPVLQTQQKVASIAGGATNSAAAKGGTPPGASGPLPPGARPKQTVTFSASDLRNALIDQYTKQVGHPPTEATLSLMYSQVCLENGTTGRTTMHANNYNLGNIHAGGGVSRYPNDDPTQPPITTPTQPTGGSYFLTTDTDKGRPYACYMRAYAGLSDGARGQVFTLMNGFPGTVDAQTPEQFNEGLQNGVRGPYYTAPASRYLASLRTGQNAYYQLFGKGPDGVGSGPNGGSSLTNSGNAAGNVVAGSSDSTAGRAVMTSSDSTTFEDPLGNSLGRNIQPDQARLAITNRQVLELQAQIDAMRAVPPLLLLVNPSSFDRSYERIADSGAKGRQGPVVHLWTENPPSISCKGDTAAQYAVNRDGDGGLTGANRVYSLSYLNLLSLVMIYKNNGLVYAPSDGTAVEKGSEGVALLPASVYIYYDGHVYIGSFDDFSVEDSGDKPFNMEYSFKFNVRYDIEAAEVSDYYVSPLV